MQRPEPSRPDPLAAECSVFCIHLAGCATTPEILAAYRRAHDQGVAELDRAGSPLDRALLALARSGELGTRLADGYAALFARTGPLRRKLVLLVAILESREATAVRLDALSTRSRPVWIAGIALRVLVWALSVVLTGLLLAPLRLRHRIADLLAPRAAGGARSGGEER